MKQTVKVSNENIRKKEIVNVTRKNHMKITKPRKNDQSPKGKSLTNR
jgi:hypothetical protein